MAQLGTKKSRHGCTHCKRRRVKCDETAPCSNCVRRGDECSLLQPSPSGSSQAGPDAPARNTQEWLQDLELMNHYSLEGFVFGGQRRPEINRIWREIVPTIAMQHPFLMHGILALSALHIATTRKKDELVTYLRLCDQHQSIALEEFRSLLLKVTAENANALFAFAATVSATNMARTTLTAIQRSDPPYVDMQEWTELLILARGVRGVVQQSRDYVHAGPLRAIMHGYATPEGALTPEPVRVRFDQLYQMTAAHYDDDTRPYVDEAIKDLLESYKTVYHYGSEKDVESGIVIKWASCTTSEFTRLVSIQSPPALVVLAHYAALCSVMRSAWYVQSWAGQGIRGIEKALGAEWQHWLEWPRAEAEESMPSLRNPDGIMPSPMSQYQTPTGGEGRS